ncbi:unnamed protein product, partial [Discosporangium mesarthrocarpum]
MEDPLAGSREPDTHVQSLDVDHDAVGRVASDVGNGINELLALSEQGSDFGGDGYGEYAESIQSSKPKDTLGFEGEGYSEYPEEYPESIASSATSGVSVRDRDPGTELDTASSYQGNIYQGYPQEDTASVTAGFDALKLGDEASRAGEDVGSMVEEGEEGDREDDDDYTKDVELPEWACKFCGIH